MVQPLTSDHFPYLPVTVTIRGLTFRTEALIDTGFDGALILPESFATSLPGEPFGESVWRVGDGSVVWAPDYEAEIRVGSIQPPIKELVTILSAEGIIGRRLIDKFRVVLDHGRQVIVEP